MNLSAILLERYPEAMVELEMVSLQRQDFQTNLISSFQNLCTSGDFSDITLVCEDGQQINAHKIVLAYSSYFFGQLLQNNLSSFQSHPLVFMRGISYVTLSALMNFAYKGKVEVLTVEVDELLNVADQLGFQGLSRQEQEKLAEELGRIESEKHQGGNEGGNKDAVAALEGRLEGLADLNSCLLEKLPREPLDEITMSESPKVQYTCDRCDKTCNTIRSWKRHIKKHVQKNHKDSSLLQSLDVNSGNEEIVSKGELLEQNPLDLKTKMEALTGYDLQSGKWACRQCGKSFKYKFNLRRHAEMHIDGFSYTCATCGKTFSQTYKLRNHISRRHSKERDI